MGFRKAVLLGFVLLILLLCGSIASATQNSSHTNETVNQIPQGEEEEEDGARAGIQLRSAQIIGNGLEHGGPARGPVSYRLKIYQLRKTPPRSPVGQIQSVTNLTSGHVGSAGAVKVLVEGPDLNPPVKQETKVLVKSEQRVPAQALSVAAHCGEDLVTVEVKQDFLGNRQLIRPSDLTLGGCDAVDASHHILKFRTELQGCGSTLTMTDEALVYSFSLMYSPKPIGITSVLRTNPAEVIIECHYLRRHLVSGGALSPTWKLFAADAAAKQQLRFSLRLVTEDWQSQRPSGVYFLSDVVRVEASVLQGHHVPLRVYVDSCVATIDPDPESEPRYPFIQNHGCFSDAKLTGASSYFMQRSREDKLHFQLKAFRFRLDRRSSLYITCHLKATTVSVPINSQHKACSFLTEANRWVASGGDNNVCGCCESSCSEPRRKRRLAPDVEWEATATVGPILLQEEEELMKPPPPPSLVPLLQTSKVTDAASSSSLVLLGGAVAALVMVVFVFVVCAICSIFYKPTGYAVYT